ncbi:MAG: dihydrodipicolinate synthase family protein [Spirochaetaceae bacterium]
MTRAEMVGRLFPDGIPRLWCPLLTHYDEAGRIDRERMRAHLLTLTPRVNTFLAPGSTGDGWEMSPEQRGRLLSFLTEAAPELGFTLLVGVLETGKGRAREAVSAISAGLGAPTPLHAAGDGGGTDDTSALKRLAEQRVCGFTVTPPAGAELSQEEIRKDLAGVLELGLPTALYQLPQITGNEMSPDTVTDLAGRYRNFYLFKDTSGADRVAYSGRLTAAETAEHEAEEVFLLRGAEGDYAEHLKAAGGRYDGFLLSTANSFSEELSRIIELVHSGRSEEARALSRRVQAVVDGVFEAVSPLAFGNPFANANKAIDHVRAFHPEATRVSPPMTHSGTRLPEEAVQRAEELLARQQLLPERGYLAG